MKKINLGKTEQGDDMNLDFDQEKIRFVLLIGRTGSGKSIFHTHLYRELMAGYTPEEVGLIFMDMTQVDFARWDSKYLVRPVIVDTGEALNVLENLKDEKRKIFVHIEECDMIHRDRSQFERGINNVLHNNKNIILVYSTSRIDTEYLPDWMERFVDMKVVFQVRDKETSRFLLGNDIASTFTIPGERILVFHDKQIKCVPFTEEDVEENTKAMEEKYGEYRAIDKGEEVEAFERYFEELYESVKAFVIETQRASIPLLQRQFSMGYPRAARLMTMLEERGVISDPDNEGERKVLIVSK